jgi:sugar/nucleoside kinase (ribokinase family)
MYRSVACAGDLLVEVMRRNVGDPLGEPGIFVGPYPSGASGIFIDAVARLNVPAKFVGAVGKDDFGALILRRFREDGVDTSRIKEMNDFTTGVAFVTYFEDGSRRFIYHMARAATGQLYPRDVSPEYLADVAFFHVMGSTMFLNEHCAEACVRGAEIVKRNGGKVSFDPNFRPELVSRERLGGLFEPILACANIVFPTMQELEAMTGETSEAAACKALLGGAQEIIAIKKGHEGCSVYTDDGTIHVPAYPVQEVDPTGAGDCYCAGFLSGLIREKSIEETVRFANAVGALAVTKKGPMEGAPYYEQADALAQRGAS